MSHSTPIPSNFPKSEEVNLGQMEAAVALIEHCQTLQEWRDKTQAEGGPLHGKTIPISVERIVIDEIFKITKDQYQKTTDTFNLNQRLN